jgi:hypothetical protein
MHPWIDHQLAVLQIESAATANVGLKEQAHTFVLVLSTRQHVLSYGANDP